jgi:hypothetical protein
MKTAEGVTQKLCFKLRLTNILGVCQQSLYMGFTIFLDQSMNVRFEACKAVTVKNGVFWDVTSCGSCQNRRFGGT